MTPCREELGLSKPLPARYVTFVANLLRGDLGRSMISNRPVSQLIWERLPYTLILAGAAVVLALVIGGVSGAVAGLHAGGYLDALIMGGVSIGIAVPTFWSSLLLVMVFSLKLGWLPVVGADSARHLLLPAFVLALPTAAMLARLLRSGLHDALGADYVRTAYAKGLTSQQVLMGHALRNSLVPVVAVMGLQIGYLIGGAFVVETVFAWPGMGRLLVQAIFDRDYPVVMGTALVIAASYLVINLLVDLAHGCLDPRVGEEAI